MKIAIVGSAKLTPAQYYSAYHLCVLIAKQYGFGHTLVSGGAEGVDSIAEEVVSLYAWDHEVYLPSEKSWEKGYKPRNALIAQKCEVLYCIRAKDAVTYGSGWTADLAEKLGKEVLRYYV